MKLILKKNLIFYGSVLALPLAGCAKRPSPALTPVSAQSDSDRVLVDLDISKYLKSGVVLSEQEKVVVQELSEGKKVSHRGLTELFVARHQNTRSDMTGTETQNTENFNAVLTKMKEKATETPDQFKESLEQVIASVSGVDLEEFSYNRDATNIFDYFNLGYFQCYSATSTYMVSRRSVLTGEEFLKDSPFVIFESGHIKSGYRSKDGLVIALEHTDLGPARETFSSEAEFEELRQNCEIRVVDSNKWILNQIFEKSLDLSNVEKRLSYLSAIFGEKYSHCFSTSGIGGSSAMGLNASILGFGSANVPAGNIKPKFSKEKPFKTGSIRFIGIKDDLVKKLNFKDLKTKITELKDIASVKSGDSKSISVEEISDKEFLKRARELNQFFAVADPETMVAISNTYWPRGYGTFYDLKYIDWYSTRILNSKIDRFYKSPAVVFFETAPAELAEYLYANARGSSTGAQWYFGAEVFLKKEICEKPDLDSKFFKLCASVNPKQAKIEEWIAENEKDLGGRPEPVR